MIPEQIKEKLDKLYARYNHRRYVHPDPLEFLYAYKAIEDREVAGLVASSLAYGRVAQILKSVAIVLDVMAPSPYLFLKSTPRKSLEQAFNGFTHRFATGDHLTRMLWGAKKVIGKFGSLHECFVNGFQPGDETVMPAMANFTRQLISEKNAPGHLIALPEKGSACKRMNLFLRWMVRKDKVDPGGWDDIPIPKLIIPLDVHMHRIGIALNMTGRRQADLRTALEVTAGFKKLAPHDPVKYDFALTRFGIRGDSGLDELLNERVAGISC